MMTIEEAAARLRKRNMTREQVPLEASPRERTPVKRYAIYAIHTRPDTGEEIRRSLVDTKAQYEAAQGVAMAKNVSEPTDLIFVVVLEVV
jgi:hypothetical protein